MFEFLEMIYFILLVITILIPMFLKEYKYYSIVVILLFLIVSFVVISLFLLENGITFNNMWYPSIQTTVELGFAALILYFLEYTIQKNLFDNIRKINFTVLFIINLLASAFFSVYMWYTIDVLVTDRFLTLEIIDPNPYKTASFVSSYIVYFYSFMIFIYSGMIAGRIIIKRGNYPSFRERFLKLITYVSIVITVLAVFSLSIKWWFLFWGPFYFGFFFLFQSASYVLIFKHIRSREITLILISFALIVVTNLIIENLEFLTDFNSNLSIYLNILFLLGVVIGIRYRNSYE